jgi:hypothetical protein
MIKVYTTFDISNSGIGRKNFQTLKQIINLRCQCEITAEPVWIVRDETIPVHPLGDNVYMLEFSADRPEVYSNFHDKLHYLKQDSTNIPMLVAESAEFFRVEMMTADSNTANIIYVINSL